MSVDRLARMDVVVNRDAGLKSNGAASQKFHMSAVYVWVRLGAPYFGARREDKTWR
jgi:hypothetical protein